MRKLISDVKTTQSIVFFIAAETNILPIKAIFMQSIIHTNVTEIIEIDENPG